MAIGITQSPAGNLADRLRSNWIMLLVAVVGFLPLLWNFFILSWKRPAYQFFPMALIAAGMLAWRGAEQAGSGLIPGSVRVTRGLALSTLAMCLLANYLWSPWLGFITFLAGLATAIWGLGGKPLLKAFFPVGLMLLAIVPPPWGLDETLTIWLRGLATDLSSSLLDWLRVTHVQDGNTIQLPGRTLFMEEACSGINSFVLCNAFCLFWVLWQRRSLAWLILAIPATSLFVVLGNIIRITTCAAADYFWHVDLLNGWRHETFGLVLLLAYCGLIMSMDQFLVFLFKSHRSSPAAVRKVPPAPAPPVAGKVLPPVFGFWFASPALALVGLGIFSAHELRHGPPALASISLFKDPLELKFSMPTSFGGWERLNSNHGDQSLVQTWGFHTTSWHYMLDGIEAVIAVDYPLDGFHDVKGCYILNGWKVLGEGEMFRRQNHEDLHLIKLDLGYGFRHAMVFHSVIDEHGNWLSKQSQNAFPNALPPTGYRIQLITGGNGLGYAPSSAEFDTMAQELFLQARQNLATQLVEQFQKAGVK